MNRKIVHNVPRPLDVRKNKSDIGSLEKIKLRVRKSGIEILKKYLKGSSELIVIDPFFYNSAMNQPVEEYINELKVVFSDFKSINSIHIIYNRNYCNNQIREAFMNLSECTITDIHTDEIHDRIWIKDRSHGKIVGSSFNGLGRNKICFIVSLPKQDMIDLKFFLQRRKLVPDNFLVIED